MTCLESRPLHWINQPVPIYVIGSKIYTGKEANVVQKDLGKRAVMLLMEPCLDKGYHVFIIITNPWGSLRN